jgi:O-methyltransferase
MAHREQLLGGSGTIFLCDTFQGVVKAGGNDSGYHGGEHKDTDISYVKDLVSKFDLRNIKLLTGIFPDATAAQLTSNRVRLLHIDVDVYQSAKDAVEHLWNHMPSGATMVFDDYGFVGCDGVTRYVDELRRSSEVLYVHNLNGHAIVIKR